MAHTANEFETTIQQIKVEQFILEIKKRPVIWNSEHKNFKSHVHRHAAWQHVAVALFEDFDKYVPHKKEEIIKEIKKKWKNLRHCWEKFYKSRLAHGKEGTRRNKHLSQLNFLSINMDESVITDNCKVPENNKKSKSLPDSVSSEKDGSPEYNNDAKIISSESVTVQDPDKSFILSFLPDLRRMPEKEKFQFKVGMINLINSIKYVDNRPETPRSVNVINDKDSESESTFSHLAQGNLCPKQNVPNNYKLIFIDDIDTDIDE